jgi:hypothetical protein
MADATYILNAGLCETTPPRLLTINSGLIGNPIIPAIAFSSVL